MVRLKRLKKMVRLKADMSTFCGFSLGAAATVLCILAIIGYSTECIFAIVYSVGPFKPVMVTAALCRMMVAVMSLFALYKRSVYWAQVSWTLNMAILILSYTLVLPLNIIWLATTDMKESAHMRSYIQATVILILVIVHHHIIVLIFPSLASIFAVGGTGWEKMNFQEVETEKDEQKIDKFYSTFEV